MLNGCTPWPDEFSKLYREKGYWEDRTIFEVLENSVEMHGSKLAVVDRDQRITYEQLGERINTLAENLVSAGLLPLDRVVIQLPNVVEFIYTYYALMKIGVIPIMALPAHRKTEIGHFIEFTHAKAYFIPASYRSFDFTAMADEIKSESATLKHVFVVGEPLNGQTAFSDMLKKPSVTAEVDASKIRFRPDPGEVALMLLSGGTTAVPKLIPRTHNDYVYNSKQSGLVAGCNESTVYLAILPIAHNWTLGSPGIQATLFAGGTVVLSPSTDTQTVFSLIEKEMVTLTGIVAPLAASWLNSTDLEKYDLRSLRVIQTGGSKVAANIRKRLTEEFHCRQQEVFGTAEGLLLMTRLDDNEERALFSSGSPVSDADEVMVIDSDGIEVPDGEPGELITRGPYTIRGYYNAPEVNRKAFTEDGFYRMGDLVHKVGRYVYSEGRIKDLVNRGGEKISCEEVEGFILAHPKVQNVAVVGMPDEIFGEKCCAFVIPELGQTLSFEELIEFLLKRDIAKFKFPERLELVNEFPVSPVGKVLKTELREYIAQKLQKENNGVF